jgi:hypothetical protein
MQEEEEAQKIQHLTLSKRELNGANQLDNCHLLKEIPDVSYVS